MQPIPISEEGDTLDMNLYWRTRGSAINLAWAGEGSVEPIKTVRLPLSSMIVGLRARRIGTTGDFPSGAALTELPLCEATRLAPPQKPGKFARIGSIPYALGVAAESTHEFICPSSEHLAQLAA